MLVLHTRGHRFESGQDYKNWNVAQRQSRILLRSRSRYRNSPFQQKVPIAQLEERHLEGQLKAHRSKSVVDWRIRSKQKLVEYKGGSCEKCGYSKCIQALEFHHLDPNEKDFTISGKSWAFEKLKKEVDKCILVCNRCHTEIHHMKE